MNQAMRQFPLRAIWLGGWLALAPLVVVAQSDEHAGHNMHVADPHAGHMMAPAQDGPWSYKGRDNPKPYTQGRWEMVPSSKNGAQFIAADALSEQARCAALRDHDYVAVDRATRAACNQPSAPPARRPAPATPSVDPHAGH
jgi:hypothetical protein